MRVYTKVVFDINLNVVEEESYEYDGPVAMCGGGGSSSGEIKYPDYMVGVHWQWLNGTGTHNLDVDGGQSITNAMNQAMTMNPYGSNLPADPADEIAAMETIADAYSSQITIAADAAALATLMDKYEDWFADIALASVYPRFEAGMRDINAVQSSAFVIGRALIEGQIAKQVDSMYERNLPVFAQTRLAIAAEHGKLAHLKTEQKRLEIIAETEYATRKADQLAAQRLWNLDVYKYGSNVLASIGSASVHTGQKSVSPGQSALGGAISGAAAGAMYASASGIGVGYGTAIGAVLGGVAGYLSV